jgi:hypothetical protein
MKSFRDLLSRRSALVLVALIAGILIGGCIEFMFADHSNFVAADSSRTNHDERITICINKTLEAVKPEKINFGVFERVWRLCGNEVFNALYLEDFAIRREKFLRQYLDERVTLWMVVTITISGVLLAAIQLFMSFKLAMTGKAEFGKDNELALESGRLSLKSSITGAVILALSFAFFMVYVIWIYSIREVPVGRPDNLQTPTTVDSVDNTQTERLPPPARPERTTHPPAGRDADTRVNSEDRR